MERKNLFGINSGANPTKATSLKSFDFKLKCIARLHRSNKQKATKKRLSCAFVNFMVQAHLGQRGNIKIYLCPFHPSFLPLYEKGILKKKRPDAYDEQKN